MTDGWMTDRTASGDASFNIRVPAAGWANCPSGFKGGFIVAASLLSATFDNCNNEMSQGSSSSSPSSPEVDIVILPNALCLSQIEEHPLLKVKLKDMENQSAAIARKIERKETRTFVVKNEIYQLLTFYVVFQGVVLTAVAQASALKCRHWWAPFTLSLIASAMTFVGVYQKLETFRQVKDDFENERFNSSVQLLVHLCKDDLAHCSTYRMGDIVAEHCMEYAVGSLSHLICRSKTCGCANN